jgi:hypothetical protein
MVAMRTEDGILVLDGSGRRLTVPGGREATWAPDVPVVAVAGPSEIVFVAPLSQEVAALALRAVDLEWH